MRWHCILLRSFNPAVFMLLEMLLRVLEGLVVKVPVPNLNCHVWFFQVKLLAMGDLHSWVVDAGRWAARLT